MNVDSIYHWGLKWAIEQGMDTSKWPHPSNVMELVFGGCVVALYWVANKLGMTYEEVNVWLFCVIWPGALLMLCVAVIHLRLRIRKLQRRMAV